jgi:CubicO group peptidase (beta-lactamase class C family)
MTNAVNGHAEARFDKVAEALGEELASGNEVGAAIAIDVDGESVLDIWGGYTDAAKTVPWGEDTIVNVWSSTKTVTSMSALMLADRGLLDLDAPVANYWPEFAANGKEDVRVRHLLSYTSGVAGWQEQMTTDDLFDWDKATSMLAAQAPWWEPGTASGYHALNYGFLIGELVRRTAGTSLKDFVRDEIAGPLGADFQIGAKPEDAGRIAQLIPPPPFDIPFDALPEDSPMRKTLTNPAPEADIAHTTAWRDADLGAVNGHGNARSLARMLSPVSRGGAANGVELLSAPTIERIFEVQSHGPDLVLAAPLKFGIGYGLATPEVLPFVPPGERVCFWGE